MKYIEIDKNGRIEMFKDDFMELEAELKNIEVKRVSYIVPKNIILRGLFHLIRMLVPDNSAIAEWTRQWKCEWIVIFNHSFRNRKEAIEFERRALINNKGKGEGQ